jgi:hypothetical protein
MVPRSSFASAALASSARLIASQVSARIAPIVRCRTDFFGLHAHGSRAKARNEAESSMERQLLVAQLAVLLEQGTAQHRLGGQAVASRLLDAVPAQVRRDQAAKLAVVVQPRGHRLELTADLVFGETIEYAGLDGAFWAHCRLRRWRLVLWNQWLDAKV